MSFLNPILLFALPMVALPVVIHLISNRRYQTVDWGAMQFLLTAKQTNRGKTRIRRWLILAARMLLIAALIFAVSRPLTTSNLGTLGGDASNLTIVLLDRSASMQHRDVNTGQTRLETGVEKVVSLLKTLGNQNSVVLIESHDNQPLLLNSLDALRDLPQTRAADASADIASMLLTAIEYLNEQQTGNASIWICSDAALNDWDHQNNRWSSINQALREKDGLSVRILNYAGTTENNQSVQVQNIRRVPIDGAAELILDLSIAGTSNQATIPVSFNINGARSVCEVAIRDGNAFLTGHRIPLATDRGAGWGYVEIPEDSNLADNRFYFSFAPPPPLTTVVVSESPNLVRGFQLAASTSRNKEQIYDAVQIRPDRLEDIDWDECTTLIWQAPLPTGPTADRIDRFIQQGHSAIFLPPESTDNTKFLGFRWGQWQQNAAGDQQKIEYWKNTEDLLGKTRNGVPLPVDELRIRQCCQLKGDGLELAYLKDRKPLLRRAITDSGAAYFLTTLPSAAHSNLQQNAIVMFVATQRAIEQAAQATSKVGQVVAGEGRAHAVGKMTNAIVDSSQSKMSQTLATDRPFTAGVYGDKKQRLLAVNRPPAEDQSTSLSKEEIGTLFAGINHQIIDDQVGRSNQLASEIWRWFVVLMGLALAVETWLGVPKQRREARQNGSEFGKSRSGVAA